MDGSEKLDSAVAGSMTYHRIVSKGQPAFYYMRVTLEFDEGMKPDIYIAEFKMIILESLKALYGEVGAASVVDVIKYNDRTSSAILRVAHRDFRKLWSALTLFGKYRGSLCAFRVNQVSAHLIGLAVDSRQYSF